MFKKQKPNKADKIHLIDDELPILKDKFGLTDEKIAELNYTQINNLLTQYNAFEYARKKYKELSESDSKHKVRFLDLIVLNHASMLKDAPIYEIVDTGILKENPGFKKDKDTFLVQDVSGASEEYKKANASQIWHDYPVTQIVKYSKGIATTRATAKSVFLLPISKYDALDKESKKAIGHKYTGVTSTQNGLYVAEVLVAGYIIKLFLEVNFSSLNKELKSAICNDLIKLNRKENGLYEVDSITLLPLNGIYPLLDAYTLHNLGNDFVTLKRTSEGLILTDGAAKQEEDGETHLRLLPFLLDSYSKEIISPELITLRQKGNGFYLEDNFVDEKKKLL